MSSQANYHASIARLLDQRPVALCATSGCMSFAEADGRCSECLAGQVRALRADLAATRRQLGWLIRLSRLVVDLLTFRAESPLCDPGVGGPWLSELRASVYRLHGAVYGKGG